MGNPVGITVHTVEDLKRSPDVLRDLVSTINIAWTQNEKAGFEGPRFASDEDLIQLLGSDGLCAAARSDANIIASASAVPWHPCSGGDVDQALKKEWPTESSLVEQGLSYEVKVAITANTPESRGKGLVERCVKELAARLGVRHAGETDLVLWVQVAEDRNGAYWRRRGYEQVGPTEIKQKGTWGATEDFRFTTLLRRFSLPS